MLAVTRYPLYNEPRRLPGPLSVGFDPQFSSVLCHDVHETFPPIHSLKGLMMELNCQVGRQNWCAFCGVSMGCRGGSVGVLFKTKHTLFDTSWPPAFGFHRRKKAKNETRRQR